MKTSFQQILCYSLLAIGLLQMVGDLAGLDALKAVAAATGASPAPKVFSAANGLETFSSSFFLEWRDSEAKLHSIKITPEMYAKIRGPYNRRNVYGAALAYGPVLRTNKHVKPMFEAVSRYAFCGDAPLLRELGIEPSTITYPLTVRVAPKSTTNPSSALPLSYLEKCL